MLVLPRAPHCLNPHLPPHPHPAPSPSPIPHHLPIHLRRPQPTHQSNRLHRRRHPIRLRPRRQHPTDQSLHRPARSIDTLQRHATIRTYGRHPHHSRAGFQHYCQRQYSPDQWNRRDGRFCNRNQPASPGPGQCNHGYGVSDGRRGHGHLHYSGNSHPVARDYFPLSPKSALAGTTIAALNVTGINLTGATFAFFAADRRINQRAHRRAWRHVRHNDRNTKRVGTKWLTLLQPPTQPDHRMAHPSLDSCLQGPQRLIL